MTDLLRLKHLEHIGDYKDEGDLIIKVRSRKPVPLNLCCLLVNYVRNGTKKGLRFRDEPIRRQTVFIEIDRQRYKCKECGGTLYETLQDIDETHDMTKRLRVRIQKDAIERTFHDAAKINGVDAKQVERIFKAHAKRVLVNYVPKMPRVLGMDEKYIQKKPRFILGDIENHAMLDMQISRRRMNLERYFREMPGRNNVEVVCQDMWKDYREVTKAVFPNAVTVVDKFHVVKSANAGVETIRRLFATDTSVVNRVRLKNKRKLFLGRWAKAKPYTRNQLLALFVEFPVLKQAYEIKESFYEIYDAPTKRDAMEAMDWWLASVPTAFKKPFKESIGALENWRPWIRNYWDHPYTNNYVESMNNLIGRMSMQGVGYDLETLRAKALLKHGKFGEDYVPNERWDVLKGTMKRRKIGFGASLSTLEADFEAGTF